jgi:glycosyltransferase involved in cell wall biosynthesis
VPAVRARRVGCAIVSNPHEGIERWFDVGSELRVVSSADEALAAYRELLADPGAAEAMGRRARERVSTSTRTRTERARSSSSSAACAGGRPWLSRLGELERVAIVPALNEEETVGRVIDEIRAFDPGFDIVVVDDGSTDRTRASPPTAARTSCGCPFNLGIGGAMQTGFRFAFEQGYDIAVQIDGDGQHDPSQLPKILGRCSPARPTSASARASPATARTARRSRALRHQDLRGGRLRRRPAEGDRHDVRLPRRQPQRDRAVRRRLSARLPEVEATVMCVKHKLRLTEVPVTMRERGGGASSITAVRSVYYMTKVLLAIFVGLFPSLHRPTGGGTPMTPLPVSIAAAVASFLLLVVVFELIRSRRLRERYALLWLLTGVVLLALSLWRDGLNTIAGWFGVETYPPAILGAIGALFILVVLLHYSTVISRLSDQNTILAQRLALLEQELREG